MSVFLTRLLDELADEIYPEGRQFIDTDTATFRVRKEWAEKLRAIRAAVGGVGETVAWWREDHVCHAHELTTADALADGYKPCVIKCEDCAWNASLCDTHGAVGGEAVGFVELVESEWRFSPLSSVSRDMHTMLRHGMHLYASPPATVDVVAIRKALNDIREAVTQEPEDKFGYSQVDHGSGIPRAYSVRENILCTIDNRLDGLIGEKA